MVFRDVNEESIVIRAYIYRFLLLVWLFYGHSKVTLCTGVSGLKPLTDFIVSSEKVIQIFIICYVFSLIVYVFFVYLDVYISGGLKMWHKSFPSIEVLFIIRGHSLDNNTYFR